MTPANAPQVPPSVEDVFHKRASFRALLQQKPSLVEAAETHVASFGDHEFANHEMLRTNVVMGQEGGHVPARVVFAEEREEVASQVGTVLSLQRLSLRNVVQHQRRPLLSALAGRDDVLREEIETNGTRLTREREQLTEELVRELETDTRLAEIARGDLRKIARMVLEQEAMRETAAREGIGEPRATFAALCRAARERVSSLVPSLEQGAPLRGVLAADIALENARQEAPVTVSTLVEPTRSGGRGR